MKKRFYWHIHHGRLLETLNGPLKNRIDYIKKYKPKEEVAVRLKLMKPVKGKVPANIVKSWDKYLKAWRNFNKAGKVYYGVEEKWQEAWKKYYKAWHNYYEAGRIYYKMGEEWENTLTGSKEIRQLHEKECPDCPWSGETIFNY